MKGFSDFPEELHGARRTYQTQKTVLYLAETNGATYEFKLWQSGGSIRMNVHQWKRNERYGELIWADGWGCKDKHHAFALFLTYMEKWEKRNMIRLMLIEEKCG